MESNMRSNRLRPWHLAAVIPLLLSVGAEAALAQSGTITGRLTDGRTGGPIDQGHVRVIGTALGAETNANGEYTIRGVQPGNHHGRANPTGHKDAQKPETVEAQQSRAVSVHPRR